MAFRYLQHPGDPTLVMLHGTGGNEEEMFQFGRSLLPRAGVVSPLGNEPEGRLNRWFRRLAEGVFDEPNLLFRTDELADWLPTVAPGRRIAVGFSNGANIAAALLLRRPEVLDGAALLAPMVPYEPESLPNLEGKPILMICGENDPIVPRANASALATMLATAGADLTVHWHPGGHGMGPVERNVLAAWLTKI